MKLFKEIDSFPFKTNYDLVFYLEPQSYPDWNHVAVIVDGMQEPTTNENKYIYSGLKEPLIIDHDGPTKDLPRSIGDTSNEYIQKVSILKAP